MERMYYDKETFIIKWGQILIDSYGINDFSKFLDGNEIRKNLGEAARNKALNYDWSRVLPMWMSLFENLMPKSSAPSEVTLEKV